MMTTTLPEDLRLQIDQELVIQAPPATVFRALLSQLRGEFGPREHAMPMTLEAWPGGRWFRDLGDQQGHLWGHVQVIKQDSLLEICGPLFMSYPSMNFVQFRLVDEGAGTHLKFTHQAIGLIDEDHRSGATEGWTNTLQGVKTNAEQH